MLRYTRTLAGLVGSGLLLLSVGTAYGVDWPQWRFDGFHTATTPEELPDNLELKWVMNLPKTEPAWDIQKEMYCYGGPGERVPNMLSFDIAYQPVVSGSTVFYNSPNNDRITAVNLENGREKWRFYAQGPIRFAPLVSDGKVYFGSDDGYLYCVSAVNGRLVWKDKLGPDNRKVMGNDRLISKWCVRGAPMLPGASVNFENAQYAAWHERLAAAANNVFSIATADDDLEEKVADGSMDVGSSDLELNYEGTGMSGAQIVGMRFNSEFLRIPAGAAIDSAFVQFAVDETKGGTEPCTVTVYGDASGNSAPLTGDAHNLSSRTRTAASVRWVVPVWNIVGDQGPAQRTPDLSAIIAEVTSRPGWQPDGYITLLIYGNGGSGLRCADARDESQKTAYLQIYSGQLSIDSVTNRPERFITVDNPDASTMYVASGLYPMEGTFVRAIDPKNGKVVWINDGSSIFYTKQPHSTAEGFNGISPQGYLCAAGEGKLVVPNGRGMPAVFDRLSGTMDYFKLGDAGKQSCGYHLVGGATAFHNRVKSYDITTGNALSGSTPIMKNENDVAIMAGSRMYTAGQLFEEELAGATQTSIETSDGSFSATVDGRVVTLVAANGALLASTDAGKIYCYAAAEDTPPSGHGNHGHFRQPPVPAKKCTPSSITFPVQKTRIPFNFQAIGRQILHDADYQDGSKGICIINGLTNGYLVEYLARETDLTVIGFDENEAKVNAIRKRLDDAGLYGRKAHLIAEEFDDARVPSYIASIIISERERCPRENEKLVREVFRVLRPYGGTAFLPVRRQLVRAALRDESNAKVDGRYLTRICKVGSLPNTDQWTHGFANAAKTVFSKDYEVKLPLGMTWFGGSADNTNDEMLPRHGHGLIPLISGGRIFQQGRDVLRAVDLYTGRVLWENQIPNLGQYSDYTGHETGHLGLGNNLVALNDNVYVLGPQNRCGFSTNCLVFDAATGAAVNDFYLPEGVAWGMIMVSGDYLITTSDLLQFDPFVQECYTRFADAGEPVGPGDRQSRNGSMALRLFVLDRHTGKMLWQRDAVSGFNHNALAVGNGKVFVVDQTLKQAIDVMSRVGITPPAMGTPSLFAFDLASGNVLWSKTTPEDRIFGTWLSYSEENDKLVEAEASRSDYYSDEGHSKMAVYAGLTGDVVWKQLNRSYAGGPVMLDGQKIRTNGYTFNAIDLFTGDILTVPNPITGIEAEITAQKHYGCTFATGCPNLLVVRSGGGGYIDLEHNAGVGNFGGFKTGCTPSLVPAEGVVASPEYTRTCGCSYQLQTSCVMVHEPENDVWLSNQNMASQMKSQGGKFLNVGLNFGAPGDRFDTLGTMWLDYPQGEDNANNGSYTMPISVSVSDADAKYIRHHSASVIGEDNWVACSAIEANGTIVLQMGTESSEAQAYTVDLIFAETEGKHRGERVFSVMVNGVSTGPVDIAAETGKSKVLVKTLTGVMIGSELTIELAGQTGTPILSGIRAVRSDLVEVGMKK